MNFKDKVVVITGASKGLGKALAETFSKEGSLLALIARKKFDLKLNKASYFQADISNETEFTEVVQEIVKKFGRIDIFVNNAGIWIPPTPFIEIPSKRIKDLFEVNVFGSIYGSKLAALQMKKQKSGGLILQVISTSALEGREGESIYCSAKFALDGFSKSIRKELGKFNIKVYSVFPGGMKTELFNEKIPDSYDDYMNPRNVVSKIINNLKLDTPEEELILRRPKK